MRTLVAALLLLTAPARAQELFSADGSRSTLTYHLVHKLHKFDGVSRKLEGRARLSPDGRAQVMVRAPIESFDSGNVNRDAHMKEAVEAARFPLVELKALAEGVTPPATFPATVEKTFKAQLDFHGVQRTFELPVKLAWESPTRVRATGHFKLSLEEYQIERPSLMFVKVDDAVTIDAELTFTRP